MEVLDLVPEQLLFKQQAVMLLLLLDFLDYVVLPEETQIRSTLQSKTVVVRFLRDEHFGMVLLVWSLLSVVRVRRMHTTVQLAHLGVMLLFQTGTRGCVTVQVEEETIVVMNVQVAHHGTVILVS
jgi:hypothetical protein